MGLSPWLVSFPTLMALVATAALLWLFGRRGVRVDDAPLCRRCRYDLLPEGAEAASVDGVAAALPARCPECGATIGAPNAVLLGHRKALRGLYVASAGVGVVAVLIGALLASPLFSSSGLQRLKPLWLLRREATTMTGPAAGAAASEIQRRFTAGRVPHDEVALIAAELIDAHEPAGRLWEWSQDKLVIAARSAGLVDDEQWARYGIDRLSLAYRVRPRVREGSPLAVSFELGAQHASGMDQAAILPGFRLLDERGTTLASTMTGIGGFRLGPRDHAGATNNHQLDVPLPVGVYNLILEAEYGASFLPGQALRRMKIVRQPVSFEVVPRESSTCQLVDDAELAAALEGTVVATYAQERDVSGYGRLAIVEVRFPAAPGPAMAFEAYLFDGERRYGPEYLICPELDTPRSFAIVPRIDGPLNAGAVRLELRPSNAAAERTADIDAIWSGSLVFDAIPVANRLDFDGETQPPLPVARVESDGRTP